MMYNLQNTNGRFTMAKKNSSTKSEVGDIIKIQNVGAGAAVAAGRGATASITSNESVTAIVEWVHKTNKEIDSLPDISQAEKEDLKQQIEKIGDETKKDLKADVNRLEKLINTIAVMSPDIFDIVIATLANPLAGIGLVIQKVGNKANLERANSNT